jgi:two-component system, chemotaxis family, chemotaxis protein CheY
MAQAYKIFIVDDDKFLLDMYALKFKNKGHEVFTAHDGVDALSKLKEGLKPDVAILDVVMPQMDGLELLSNIRKEPATANCRVIMLTNQGYASDIEKAEALGIDGYIIKATTIPSEVVNEVEKILEKIIK